MATGQKVVHSDYIARIRYSNALPPPPNPPKLLDIPGTGLAGGQYTSSGYASRLAREQPLNIEADAELGMPIDLIGIPGVFEGDERALLTRTDPQPLHPADKALLKPLSAFGKPNTAGGAVSFLRRTEYTTASAVQHFTSSTSKDLLKVRADPKRRKAQANRDDPINIMRNIVKGFDIAYPRDAYKGEDSTTNLRGAQTTDAEVKAWSNPKHPSKSNVTLLDSYPILPDLEAIPSTGFYMVMKFATAPIQSESTYDERLDNAILRPVPDPLAEASYHKKHAEWNPDSSKPEPIREYDYDYFLPTEVSAVRGLKRKLDASDVEKDDPELYTDDIGDNQRAFKFARLRTYETFNQTGDPNSYYNDSVALALHDPAMESGAMSGAKKRLTKGAYFYPVVQRTSLRPKRHVGRAAYTQTDDQKIDELNVMIGDPSEDLQAAQLEKRGLLDPAVRTAEVAG